MSAYDNPSIIRNDAALIWGQTAGNISESFTKSFAQAKEIKEAKEKELRLINEKKEKESNQLIIEQQQTKQGYDTNNQKIINSSVIKGLNQDDALSKEVMSVFANNLNVVGENKTLIATTVQPKEAMAKAMEFEKKATIGRETTISTMGAVTDQVNSYKDMTAGKTIDITWSGETGLDKLNNMLTCSSLDSSNFNFQNKVTKRYIPNPEDPSRNSLQVSTNIGDKTALKEKLKIFYVNKSSEELDAIIEDGIKENKITQDGNDYRLNFTKEIGQGTWDGTFYKSIPKLTNENLWGEAAGNIENTKTGTINESYFTLPSIRTFANKKMQGEVRYLRMGEIQQNLVTYYNAESEGLLESYLSDDTVLQGYLSNRVDGGTTTAADFRKDKTVEQQKSALASLILQKDIKTKLSKSYRSELATAEDVKNGLADPTGKVWFAVENEKEIKVEKPTAEKPEKATAAELSQAALNKRIKTLIKTKKGGVSVGGYTLMLQNGRWGIYDKDGVPKAGTEDETRPSVLATYIGGTLNQ